MDRGAWWATVHGVTKSQTRLSTLTLRESQTSLSFTISRSLLNLMSVDLCVCVSRSVVADSVTSCTAAHQALLSMRFSRQGYCSELPFPSPGDLSDPGIKPGSPALQVDSLLGEPPGKPKNTGMGSLSLFWGIFLTQDSNWGLLTAGSFFTS